MTFDDFDAWVRTLPGVVMDIKWEVHRTYCVGDKLFAFAGDLGEAEPRLMFKTSDLAFEMLVESGAAEPAPYLGRAKWVRMMSADALSDEEIKAYVAQSHALVAAKLTRKRRAELGIA